ncbi:MAG: hypothetical protein U0Q11_03790 [Vicinamibacterales bacterium]
MRAIRTALCATLLLAGTAFADPRPTIVYDSLPTPLSSNVASVGFEATATSEFGDHIHLKGSRRRVQSITVTMSDWASYADYKTDPRYAGNHRTWMHPVTLNIYKAKTLDAFGAPVVKLFSTTRYIEIPWRPAEWDYPGIAFNVKFEVEQDLPSDVIVGVAFNTQDYGETPIGKPGPYNSLNIGVPEGQLATVGTDDDVDAVFWNTSVDWYADGGVTGHFREDSVWAPFGTVAFRVTATGGRDDDDDDDNDHHGHGHDNHHGNQGHGRRFVSEQRRDDRGRR